jgi:hypothetical protein
VQLEHRAVPEQRLHAVPTEDEPRPTVTALAARPNGPPARHAQMRPEDDIPVEAQHQVLPDRLDRLEPPAVEALGNLLRLRPRVRRLDLKSLTDQDLQAASGPVQRVALWHVSEANADEPPLVQTREVNERQRAAAAGAAAAIVWAAMEPLDRRLFRYDYSDVALLGKLVTRTRWWPLAGAALHAANGALFGIAYDEMRRRTGADARRLALAMAMIENFALYPLNYLIDRYHPAHGEPGLPPLLSGRGLAQATARHALFGVLLGRWAA